MFMCTLHTCSPPKQLLGTKWSVAKRRGRYPKPFDFRLLHFFLGNFFHAILLSVFRNMMFFLGLMFKVRSRSLSQLDALGTSMLDTGEHRLVTGATSPHQNPQQQQQQQTQNRYLSQHQNQQHYIPPPSDCSPRLLVPSAVSSDGSHTNRHRHKLSRSQVTR